MNYKLVISLCILTTLASSNANLIDYLKNAFKGSPDEVQLDERQGAPTTVATSTVRKCPLGVNCTAANVPCTYDTATTACDITVSFCCVDRYSFQSCCLGSVRPTDPITSAPDTTTTLAPPPPTTTSTTPQPPTQPPTSPTTTTTVSTTRSTVKCG